MALPKRRHSRTRGRKRRTHYKIVEPSLIECSNCSELKLPHHICPSCGYYRGEKIVAMKES
jgi:large subunit ribosomal protein L32